MIILMAESISKSLQRPEVGAKMVQQATLDIEKDIQELIDNNANYHQYDLAGVGLYVFHNDSLLYWNNNLVGPKLIRRKVQVGNDTICNLLTGDYYVHTFIKGNLNYYIFKLVNTTYRLENNYFEKGLSYENAYPDRSCTDGSPAARRLRPRRSRRDRHSL